MDTSGKSQHTKRILSFVRYSENVGSGENHSLSFGNTLGETYCSHANNIVK